MATSYHFTKPVAIQWKLNPNCTSRYVYGIRENDQNIHHSKNGRNPNGDVILIIQLFALSDFDSVLWQN
jgi:hypothetical protein